MYMKQALFAGAVLWLVSVVNAATGILDTNKDDGYNSPANYNHSSLTNKFVWTDKDSWTVGTGQNGTGAWQPSTANDYIIRSGTIRQPTWTPYSFIGRTLQIGEGTDKNATLALGIRGPACVLNFGQNGKGKVIWQCGQFSNYYGGSCEVNGDIEILAEPQDNAGKTARFSCGTNQQVPINAEHKMGVSFWFNGAFTGTAGTLVQFHIASYKPEAPWDNCGSRASRYCFAGDMTRCYSTLRFRPWTNRNRDVPSQTDADSSHTTGEIRRSVAVFTSTTKSPMPGTIETWGGAAIELRDGVKFSVANLDLAGNDLIETGYDFGQNKGSTLTVTEKLTMNRYGKTLIRFSVSGTDKGEGAFKHPILKAPRGTVLNIDDFEFETPPAGMPYQMKVSTDTDGCSTLWIMRGQIIYLTKADAYQVAESFRKGNEGWTNHWSDLQWPRPGYEYYAEGMSLRTPTKARDDYTGNILTNSYKFLGDSLTVVAATIAIRSTREIEFPDLRLMTSGTKAVALSHYNTASENKDLLPPGYDPKNKAGMCILDGHLTYSSGMGGTGATFNYSLSVSRGFVQQMEVEGNGPIQYVSATENASSRPGAYFWLRRPNPKIYAPRTLISASKFTWTPTSGDYAGQSISIPTREFCCHVYFDSALCFGGPLDSYAIDGIEVRDYSILEPTQNVSFDDPNKGFRIGNSTAGNSPVAQFVINNDITMTIHSRINFNANNAVIEKTGNGVLELAEGCYGTFWAGGNDMPSSANSNNLVKVLEGGLKISETNCVNGLIVTIADKGRIILSAHPEKVLSTAVGAEFLAKYGFFNEKYRSGRTDRTEPDPTKSGAKYYGKSLSLEPGSSVINLYIEKDLANPDDQPPRELGLITVGAEYADEIEKALRVHNPYSTHMVQVEKRIYDVGEEFPKMANHGGKMVTFTAKFIPGLIMHVR